MTFVSIAALAIAVLAPLSKSIAWGVPLTMFSWGMALRAAVGAALATFFVGAALTAVAPAHVAASTGAALGGALAMLSARRSRHLRGITLLAWRLTQPDSSLQAQRLLDAKLDKLRRRLSPQTYAQTALFASVPLSAVGAWDTAGRHLEGVSLEAVDRSTGDRTRQALATVYLQRGELEKAHQTIDAIERPAAEAIEGWLDAMEALLLAVQGGADEALERARAAGDADGALAATYDIVRAHAHACRGETSEARAALERVREATGAYGLERALRPVGPATDMARAMLGEASRSADRSATQGKGDR